MTIIKYLFENPLIFISAIFIGFITLFTYSIVLFYYSRNKYPPGPFPLPLIGNLHLFLLKVRSNKHAMEIFNDFSTIYGPIYTFWFGPFPIVFAIGPQEIREVFNKIEFSGRPDIDHIRDTLCAGHIDIVFTDHTREWEVLRSVTHSAIRKTVQSDKIPKMTSVTMKKITEEIKNDHKIDTPYDQTVYIHNILYTSFSKLVFGIEFEKNDPDFERLNNASKILKESAGTLALIVIAPWMKYFIKEKYEKIKKFSSTYINYNAKQYQLHEKKFVVKDKVDDLIDAMIKARKEAEDESSENLKYLKPGNFHNSLSQVFLAGTETTVSALSWMFLFLANDPNGLQEKLRKEIDHIIGDDVPNLDHRANCHFVSSFINESLRFRTPIGLTLPHKALQDAQIGQFNIMKGTVVIGSAYKCCRDERLFDDPDEFKPDRFLKEDGTFQASTNVANIPFGLSGRRSCPGNKLALSQIFFILAGWFQNTKGLELVLETGPGTADLRINPIEVDLILPYPYKVKLCKSNRN